MKILIVDDQKENRMLLEALLDGNGFKVSVAENGAEALKKLRIEPFDMVISDILMPVMDGFQLCREIRSDAGLKDIAFVFYTATYTDKRDEELALRLGADRFIRKPMDPEAFIAEIRNIIEGVERGEMKIPHPFEKGDEVFKLYDERLVKKLEKKMLDLEREIMERRRAEEKLRLFSFAVKQSIEGIAVADLDGIILYANPAFAAAHGFSPEELAGRNLSVFHNEEQMPAVESANRQILEKGEFTGELWHTRRDGSVFPALMRNSLLRDESGSPIGIIGTLLDITDLKAAQKALEEREETYRTVFENTGTAMLIIDRDSTISLLNTEAEILSGYSKEEIQGSMKWTDFVAPEDLEKMKIYHEERRRGQSGSVAPSQYEFQLVDRRGNRRHIINRVTLFPDGTRSVASLMDVTQLRESEERYRTAVEQSNDGVAIIKGDVHVFVNRKYAEIFGYERQDEITGRPVTTLVHPDDRDMVLEATRKRQAGKAVPGRYDAKGVRRDGQVIYLEISAANIIYGGNQASVVFVRDITKRRRAEDALREHEAYLAAILNRIPDPICVKDEEHRWVLVNDKFCEIAGAGREALLGKRDHDFFPREEADVFLEKDDEVLKTGKENISEEHLTNSTTGETLFLQTKKTFYENEKGERFVVAVGRDLTEYRRLEEQFRQAQKMEAIGTLAGGIAHDFNNILSVVLGNAELALMDLNKDMELYPMIEEIRHAGERASALTRQILAFGRKQVIEPVVLDINDIIRDSGKMLGRLIGEHIRTEMHLDPSPGLVLGDPGQMEQVLINLAVNAKDAMPGGGTLFIESANVELGRAFFASRGLKNASGAYVLMKVRDTGIGMDDRIMSRIFEPFFTTKGVGKGTGLGLATVYGIVKQNQGYIFAESLPGKGSAFSVYLPCCEKETVLPEEDKTEAPCLSGSETILLVEDDNTVRRLASRILTQYGYRVLEAESGEKAIEISSEYEGSIHLVLTDVVMPGINGRETADRVRSGRKESRVLYMSGYTDDIISHFGVIKHGIDLLEKPFSPEGLARKVRKVLEKPLAD